MSNLWVFEDPPEENSLEWYKQQMEGMEKELDRAWDDNKILSEEIELLRKKHKNLKETIWPVCEYAAEIYNREIPVSEMPPDTIQRLNSAFKMIGG